MNNKTERKRPILNRPVLALFLMSLGAYLLAAIVSTVVTSFWDGQLASVVSIIAVSLLLLFFYKKSFRGSFDGNLKFKNVGKGLYLLLPALAMAVLNLCVADYSKVTLGSVALALISGFGPGILEETCFRGLPASNFMRVWKGKRIILAAVLSSLAFGLFHLMNLTSGAELGLTLLQVVYAAGIGLFFCAVYFRTGSLIPPILMHAFIDASSWIETEESADPSLISKILVIVICVALGVIGIYYLRPAKQDEIREIWAEKFSQNAEEEPADETAEPEV